MIRRILIGGLLITAFQIGIYTLILYTGYSSGKESYEFDLVAQLSIVSFGLLLFVINLLVAIINRRFWTWAMITIIVSLFAIDLVKDSSSWESYLFNFAGIVTIFSKFAIEKLILVFTNKINSGFVPIQLSDDPTLKP